MVLQTLLTKRCETIINGFFSKYFYNMKYLKYALYPKMNGKLEKYFWIEKVALKKQSKIVLESTYYNVLVKKHDIL